MNNQYLTFDDYKEMGGTLEESEFIRNEYAARREIDFMTFQRLKGITPVPEELRMCIFELIQRELLGTDDDNIISKSSGRLSITKDSSENRKHRASALIREYLDGLSVGGVNVFYAGNL